MIIQNFIASPPLVVGHPLYWLQSEDGSYTGLRTRSARRHVRKLCADGARSEYAPVRFLAGLPAGLYCGQNGPFLVPQFVPLASLRKGKRPPVEFHRTAGELRGMVQHGVESRLHRAVRQRLVELYQKAHDLEPVAREDRPASLLEARRRAGDAFPFDDHCRLFSGPDGWVWTSQPYFYDKAELLGFAAWHGLSVAVSPSWSWHYPGESVLIEWRQARGSFPPAVLADSLLAT